MGNKKSCLAPEVIAVLTNTTDFSSIELNDLYRQYRHDCNQNGYGLNLNMTKSEFKAMYEDIFPNGNSNNFAENLFRTYNKDGNGNINFKEFITVLNVQLNGTYEQKLIWLFDLCDLDGSDDISYNEAYEAMNILFDLNSSLIPNEDINPKQLTEYLFTKANEHHHGKVDRQFFYNAATQSEMLRNVVEAAAKCANQPFTVRKEQSGSLGRRNTCRCVCRITKQHERQSEHNRNDRNRSDNLNGEEIRKMLEHCKLL